MPIKKEPKEPKDKKEDKKEARKPIRRTTRKKVVQDMVPVEHHSILEVTEKLTADIPAHTHKAPVTFHSAAESTSHHGHAHPHAKRIDDEPTHAAAHITAMKKTTVEEQVTIEPQNSSVPLMRTPPSRPHGQKSKKTWVLTTFVILLVCMGVIIAALSLLFSRGTIVIKPKTIVVAVDTTLVAKPSASATSSSGSELSYEEVSFDDTAEAPIPSTLGSTIEKKAKGTAILYNNFSTASQKIVATTRLSNQKGQIYRTEHEVLIPGITIVNGKPTPGSATVDIVADQPGAEYNASLSDLSGDFKIVAYNGTPKYTKMYGLLKTDITGGSSGQQIIPDKAAATAAEATLKQALLSKLSAQAKAIVPAGYTLYNKAYNISYTTLPPVLHGSSTVLAVKAAYTGYMFKNDMLVRAFAKEHVSQFPADGYELVGVDTLDFNFKNASTPAAALAAAKLKYLMFTLKGNMKIVGVVPKEKLAKELAGVRLNDSAAIIKRYSVIGSAYAKIFPVWMRSLPDSPDRITIEIEGNPEVK